MDFDDFPDEADDGPQEPSKAPYVAHRQNKLDYIARLLSVSSAYIPPGSVRRGPTKKPKKSPEVKKRRAANKAAGKARRRK